MVKLDEQRDENELEKLTCDDYIKSKFVHTQNIVTAMLHEFSLGVSCSVAPFTDSYTYTISYVLLWSLLLEMCKQGNSQVRYLYTLWIKEMDLIVHIMESLLKLMPDSVLHFGESNIKKRQRIFTEKPSLSFDGWDSERLSNYCCWLFCDLLRTLPAVARQWAAEADPKLLSYADKITTSYVSSALCAEEMKAIMNQQKAFDNMKVNTHPSVREVVAVYTVEESSTELIITLATNHPLTPPKVEIPKAMISSNQTRQWLMQLTIFLTHQNGSIWDGLLLWKSNLDKKFEGIEECYICFSILHNTSHQLPKLSCQTCKKKFHSFCLYKWFTTSNKSTCPICRNHF